MEAHTCTHTQAASKGVRTRVASVDTVEPVVLACASLTSFMCTRVCVRTRCVQGLGLRCLTYAITTWQAHALSSHTWVAFVFATYGDGGPTENAVDFFAWLENKGTALPLPHLRFSVHNLTRRSLFVAPLLHARWLAPLARSTHGAVQVFGLGSTDFRHFNRAAERLRASLLALQATEFAPFVRGDASAGSVSSRPRGARNGSRFHRPRTRLWACAAWPTPSTAGRTPC